MKINMDDPLFEDIKTFIIENWGYNCEDLTRNTTLERDLGITGDDADVIMARFVDKFNIVDYSEFEISEYFGSETFDLIGPILNFFRKQKIVKKQLTLGDLEEAVKRSKLK